MFSHDVFNVECCKCYACAHIGRVLNQDCMKKYRNDDVSVTKWKIIIRHVIYSVDLVACGSSCGCVSFYLIQWTVCGRSGQSGPRVASRVVEVVRVAHARRWDHSMEALNVKARHNKSRTVIRSLVQVCNICL